MDQPDRWANARIDGPYVFDRVMEEIGTAVETPTLVLVVDVVWLKYVLPNLAIKGYDIHRADPAELGSNGLILAYRVIALRRPL